MWRKIKKVKSEEGIDYKVNQQTKLNENSQQPWHCWLDLQVKFYFLILSPQLKGSILSG